MRSSIVLLLSTPCPTSRYVLQQTLNLRLIHKSTLYPFSLFLIIFSLSPSPCFCRHTLTMALMLVNEHRFFNWFETAFIVLPASLLMISDTATDQLFSAILFNSVSTLIILRTLLLMILDGWPLCL